MNASDSSVIGMELTMEDGNLIWDEYVDDKIIQLGIWFDFVAFFFVFSRRLYIEAIFIALGLKLWEKMTFFCLIISMVPNAII